MSRIGIAIALKGKSFRPLSRTVVLGVFLSTLFAFGGFLAEFGFHQQVGENGNPHDYYIPENIFYRLCMKAKNEAAEKFKAKVADEIIPSNSQELSDASASSALKLFENPQFRVRVIMRCADPWFVAKDACDCLELTNVSKACQTLDEDEKGITKVHTLGGSQDMMLISESGLYTLIMRSNKPEAKVSP